MSDDQVKMVKLPLEEFERLVKKLKECLAANDALNDQIDAFNAETKRLKDKE